MAASSTPTVSPASPATAAAATAGKAASPYRHPAATTAQSPGSHCDRTRPFATLEDVEARAADVLGYTAAAWDGGLVPPGCCNSVRHAPH